MDIMNLAFVLDELLKIINKIQNKFINLSPNMIVFYHKMVAFHPNLLPDTITNFLLFFRTYSFKREVCFE